MTLENLKRIQEIDSELLWVVDAICKKNNIQYYLIYGTLLGAVRHHGPIPWDDDVDIVMDRENYVQFSKIMKQELNPKLYCAKVMGSGSTKYVSEIKIGKLNTTLCMPGTEHIDIMNHVQLDVFCMDYIKEMSEKTFARKKRIWSYLHLCKLNKSEKQLLKIYWKRSNNNKSFYIILLNFLHVLRFIVGEKNIEKIGYNMFVDKTKQSSTMWIVGTKKHWKSDYFRDITYLPYENHQLPVPLDYDKILRTVYGDYMIFPPENKRLRKNFDKWVFKEF